MTGTPGLPHRERVLPRTGCRLKKPALGDTSSQPNDEPRFAARGVAVMLSIHYYGAGTADVAAQMRWPCAHSSAADESTDATLPERFKSCRFGIERLSLAWWLAWLSGHNGR